ncbi:MAG: TonB-dependent receptor [Deltaproteobacteria bacterium]|nr:TonB-dependent receptor [Deltaproteobacteria bacterium]
MSKVSSLFAALAAVALLSPALPATAQQAGDGELREGIEEIVVTARKREESLQTAPLSVSALGAAELEARGFSDTNDFAALAPNTFATQTPGSAANIATSIRGIANGEPLLTVDSRVALYVDGAYIARSSGAIFDLLELERVEILRGPQGTLYGRNAAGGAINFIARKPAEKFGVRQTFSFGRFNHLLTRTRVDTGDIMGSGVRGTITALYKERDGTFDNTLADADSDPNAHQTGAMRAAFNWQPIEDLEISYAYDWHDLSARAPYFQLIAARADVAATFAQTTPLVLSSDRRDVTSLDEGGPSEHEVSGHNLTIEYNLLDLVTIKSITTYREWNSSEVDNDFDQVLTLNQVYDLRTAAGQQRTVGFFTPDQPSPTNQPRFVYGLTPDQDGDGQPDPQNVPLFSASGTRDQDQISQELQFTGELDLGPVGLFDYVAGGYYFREDFEEYNPQQILLTAASAAAAGIPANLQQGFEANIRTAACSIGAITDAAVCGPLGPNAMLNQQLAQINALPAGSQRDAAIEALPAIAQQAFQAAALLPLLATLNVPALPTLTRSVFAYEGASRNWGAFLNLDYTPPILGDRLTISLGARWSEDNRQLLPKIAGIPVVTQEAEFDKLDWSASVSYALTDDINAYVRASSGYNAGGYNPRGLLGVQPAAVYAAGIRNNAAAVSGIRTGVAAGIPMGTPNRDMLIETAVNQAINAQGATQRNNLIAGALAPFNEENLISYEIGVKSLLMQDRLQINASVFYTDYSDNQIQQFLAGSGGAASVTVNAGETTLSGFEVDFVLLPFDGMRVSGSWGYLIDDYDEFLVRDPRCAGGFRIIDAPPGIPPSCSEILNVADSARGAYRPTRTGNLALEYSTRPIGQAGVVMTARFDLRDVSELQWFAVSTLPGNPAPYRTPINPFLDAMSEDGYTLYDLRLTFSNIPGFAGGKAQVSLWGKNVTDEEYILNGIDFGALGFAGAIFGDPATWGADITFEF